MGSGLQEILFVGKSTYILMIYSSYSHYGMQAYEDQARSCKMRDSTSNH